MKNPIKNNVKNLMLGVCALALFAMAPLPSEAAKAKATSHTSAKTTVNNDLDSSVTTGDNVRINGGIRTGDNTATTTTDTRVDSNTSATVDGDGIVSGVTNTVTGAKTRVNNTLDSSVLTGDNVRINGGIRTGTNTSDTSVKTRVDSDTHAGAVIHDEEPAPGKSGMHRNDEKRKSWWHWGD